MQAAIYTQYGPPGVVHLAEVAKPVPRDNEVLIRIHATTVSTADWRARSLSLPPGFNLLGRPVFGLFGPRKPILGTELAGEIEATGKAVTRFRPGDRVFAFPGGGFGSHAEYRTMAEDGPIAVIPDGLSFETAAALSFGGTTALDFLVSKGKVAAGDKVLVVGASGCIGTAAVQIAKARGAQVTGVASAANVELVRSLGADAVIDYGTEDFAAREAAWDIIFDTTGTASFARCERALKPGGRLLAVLSSFSQSAGLERAPKGSGKQIIAGVAGAGAAALRTLAGLAGTGAFRPVIDRSYPLAQAAAALAYVETGRKRGSVLLTIG